MKSGTITTAALITLIGGAVGAYAWFNHLSPAARYKNDVEGIFNPSEAQYLREDGVPATFAREMGETLGVVKKEKRHRYEEEKVRSKLLGNIRCLSEHDGTTAFIERVSELEYNWRVAPEACENARAGVTLEDIDGILATGIKDVNSEDIRELKSAGVEPSFIEFVLGLDIELGDYKKSKPIIALHQTDRDYVSRMAEEGFNDPFCISDLGAKGIDVETAKDLRKFYTESQMRSLAFHDTPTDYAIEMAELLGGLPESRWGEDGYSAVFGQIVDLGENADTALEVLNSLLSKGDKIHSEGSFLEKLNSAITEHGLDTSYVETMYGLSADFHPWQVLSLSNADATSKDVKSLLNAGYDSHDSIPEIVEEGLVDYAVEVGKASDGNVWGGYISELHGQDIPLEYIGTLSKGADISGERMYDIYKTGAPAEDIVAIMRELPMLDQKVDDIWRAGVRPEMIPQIKKDPTVKDLLGKIKRKDFIDQDRFSVNPSVFLSYAVADAAHNMDLI